MPTPGLRRFGVLRGVVLVAMLAAVAVAIAGLIPGSEVRLEHAAPGWLAAAVIAELFAIGSYAALFHGVFSGGRYRLTRVRSTQIAVGELGAFVVVPTGAGGPALRVWALMRGGMPLRVVMSRSVVHAAIFNLPYLAAALILGTSVATGLGPGRASLAIALAPLGLIAITLAVAAGAFVYARKRRDAPVSGWRRIGRDIVEAVPDGLRALPSAVRRPQLTLEATGFWAGDVTVLVFAFHAAHGVAPIGVIVLAYMLGQLGNALPLPGGVGGVEPIMLGVLTASGVGLALGGAAVVLYRFISLGMQAIAGTIAVATLVPALQRSSAGPVAEPDSSPVAAH